jgi:pimeloyl-ACP methyl ester carboxylesterase
MQHKTIELGGQRSLHVAQAGQGADLILLHGALGTHQDWLIGPFHRLAEDFRVTAVDRPGHGKSRRPRFEGTPRDQAAQIAAAMAELGIERATVVGHSIGGLVALAMAERFPKFVSSLVLIAPLCFPEPRPLEHLLMAPRALPIGGPVFSQFAKATFDPLVLKMVQRLMFAPQPVPDDWEERYPYEDILRSDVMVAEGEETAAVMPMSPAGTIDIGAIRAPATILTGTSDKVVNPRIHARPLAAMMKGSRLIELDGIGHMAHHVAADEVVQAIREGAARALEPQSSAR